MLPFLPSVTLEIRKVMSYFVFPCSFFSWFSDTELKSLADGVQDEVKTHATRLDSVIHMSPNSITKLYCPVFVDWYWINFRTF